VGFGEQRRDTRSRLTAPGRARLRWIMVGCVVGVLCVQIGVLSAVPFGWRTVVSSLLPLAMFVGWATMFVWAVWRRRAGLAMSSVTFSEPRADAPDSASSVRMLLACELARRGASAVWIAEQCELPVALAELVIADVRGRAQHPDASTG
jgi:hypothetical protein